MQLQFIWIRPGYLNSATKGKARGECRENAVYLLEKYEKTRRGVKEK